MDREPAVETVARRRRNPEATREDILAAARTVLASDGPDGLSLSKVAHLAGVNRGTAYQHFETKEDLIKATVAWVGQHLSETVFGQGSLDELDAGDLDQAPRSGPVYEFLTGLAEFAVENPELGRVWLFEMLSCEDPDQDVFFKRFKESIEIFARSEYSEEGIDAEVLSVILLAAYFLWPALVNAKARTRKEREAMSLRMRREVLRLSLYGTLRTEAFPQLQKLLEK